MWFLEKSPHQIQHLAMVNYFNCIIYDCIINKLIRGFNLHNQAL